MERRGPIYDSIRERLRRYSEVAPDWWQFRQEALRQFSTYEDEGVADTEHEGIYKFTTANRELEQWCLGWGLCEWLMRDGAWPEWIRRICVWELLRKPVD